MYLIFVISIFTTVCSTQNLTNNGGKSYFFKMGKASNEFRVNNRIMYLNHNITDLELPVIERKRAQQTAKLHPKQEFNIYLDEEWNYDHNKNFSKYHLPMFVNKFYESASVDPNPKITTRILFNTNRNTTNLIIKFNLESLKNEDSTIEDADLYFYWPLKNNSKIFREAVVLRLYQIEKSKTGEFNQADLVGNPDTHKLFNVIYVSKAHKGWQMFNVKKPIDNWLKGEENLGLILTISNYDTNETIEIFNDTNIGNFTTFIITKSRTNDSLTNNTENRTVISPNYTSSECQREGWNVDFSTMGWNKFVISPEEFTAYDCIGKCTKSTRTDENHFKLLHMFQKRTGCCVPTKYFPLTMMFFDRYGDIAIKNYDKMIVAECGCR
ncbi:unnamed protein product [Phyllotreta striolata]|uniref:TGF-beta family profile domain-containing protein n=1 Tax=Phyllotreta striolata TaxID=444603 RepID=A0A9N9TQD5_PHYSR|nr:unnamed protein product [Phyllotreta striolata]